MLLDSNVIIYAAQPQHEELRVWIARHSPAVSAINDRSPTIRLFGRTPTHEGEVIRATLAKEGETYRWKIDGPPPPPGH